MKKRNLLGLLAALPLALLSACGGGSDDGDATVRLVNASPGYSALDLSWDDTLKISKGAFGVSSDSVGFKSGTYSLAFTSPDTGSSLLTVSKALESGKKYAVVAYGWEGALKTTYIEEDTDEPDDKKAIVSVFNTASDAGALAVYLTGESDNLESATPVFSSVAEGTRTIFSTLNAGTYRLRVTAASDSSDVRLDVSGVKLDNKSVITLIMTPTTGGKLVNSLQFVQGGAVTKLMTNKVRVRAFGVVGGGANLSLSVGSTSILDNILSPVTTVYKLVDAGSQTVRWTAGDGSEHVVTQTFAAGADITLMVGGETVAAAQLATLVDDNRLPTSSSKAKIRLVHASPSHKSQPMTLKLGLTRVIENQAWNTASAYKSQDALSSGTMSVVSLATGETIGSFDLADNPIVAKRVYTVLVYDGSDGAALADISTDSQ